MRNLNDAMVLQAIGRVAQVQHDGASAGSVWAELERSLTEVFGQQLFTVLAYDEASSRLGRLHSNRPDINPIGGMKRVTRSRWSEQVLSRGDIFIGSTRDDIRSVFSEYQVLWSIGCESVLNIPVRRNAITIGTLNLLGEAHRYDDADVELAIVFAQLAVAPLDSELHRLRGLPDPDHMEQV